MKPMVDILVGGQYGGEGKGKIVAYLANEYRAAVRGGAENAGHTLRHNGKEYKMQVIPAAWPNPDCMLYVGAGTVFSRKQLLTELSWFYPDREIANRLIIDPDATMIIEEDVAAEMDLGGKIGSTVHGCGAALARKVMRRNHTPAKEDNI